MWPIQPFIFYTFSAVLIIAACSVILMRQPVHAVLSLVLAFFASAILWMLLQAEFLALLLIFIYVGALMTVFLFAVMMLRADTTQAQAKRSRLLRYVLLGVLLLAVLLGTLLWVVNPQHFPGAAATLADHGPDYSNVRQMGLLLYTQYLYPFEVASLILLTAIIAVIALVCRGRRSGTKAQLLSEQLSARKQDRLRLVDLRLDQS